MARTLSVHDVTPYQLFMLALCVFALSMLGAETLTRLDESTSTILAYADLIVCVFFLVDFIHNVVRAPNRLRYFVTWGWIDLLSSIPAFDFLRLGRMARLLRILRLLRAIRSVHFLWQFLMSRRGESVGLAAGLGALLLVVAGSISVLQFEGAAGGNIQTADDAVWWAIATMTTVGYGDRYPITSEGRVIAAILMMAGVSLVSVLTALVAGWFLAPAAKEAAKEREELKELIEDLRRQLTAIENGSR